MVLLLFQSTRPIRSATVYVQTMESTPSISIHAPHTERDCANLIEIINTRAFQSTRPIRSATILCCLFRIFLSIFQSTRPIRSATLLFLLLVALQFPFQSTRPIRSATRRRYQPTVGGGISIHAPHTERDGCNPYCNTICNPISIHAPHTERDSPPAGVRPRYNNISIHAPHTERDRHTAHNNKRDTKFQSTRPIRSATFWTGMDNNRLSFQSTRPIRSATTSTNWDCSCRFYFNPRAPYGARLGKKGSGKSTLLISIHAPHTERDGISVFSVFRH